MVKKTRRKKKPQVKPDFQVEGIKNLKTINRAQQEIFAKMREDLNQAQQLYEERQAYYASVSADELNREMLTYGIEINEAEVITRYEQNYAASDVIAYYEHLYDRNLNDLAGLKTRLDADCIKRYINLVIEEHYDLLDRPDVDALATALIWRDHYARKEKADVYVKILQNINKLYLYHEERNLRELFQAVMVDPIYMLEVWLEELMDEMLLNTKQKLSIAGEIKAMCERYDDEDTGALMRLAARLEKE